MAQKVDARTSQNGKPAPVGQAAPELRSQLLKRLAVAGGLVAVLLAVLAAFDYLTRPVEEEPLPVFTQPVPVAPKKIVSQPVAPLTETPEAPPPAAPAAPETAAVAEPAVVSAAPTPAPALPVPAATPERVQESHKQVSRPAPVKTDAPPRAPTASRPILPVPEAQETRSAQRETLAVPERTAAPPMVAAMPEAVRSSVEPNAMVKDTRPAAGGQTPAPPRLFSGFVLQAGIFNSIERAEALHAKLTLSGVPSQIETRVQVGPFRTRQEAAAAQAKLRELGIETVLVPPKGER